MCIAMGRSPSLLFAIYVSFRHLRETYRATSPTVPAAKLGMVSCAINGHIVCAARRAVIFAP
ncbi:MAG: hypothetical protein O2890_05455, partial [Cyanobacteria bacterium]|nr:hypothetical protein [Cyanobacteriota bacterium]